jgi:hypothetical protein
MEKNLINMRIDSLDLSEKLEKYKKASIIRMKFFRELRRARKSSPVAIYATKPKKPLIYQNQEK